MNQKLSDWANLAQIVSGFALVMTLVVLVLETRGNTDAIRAATYQSVVDSITMTLDQRVSDPEIARVWREGFAGQELSEVDQDRFNSLLMATTRRFENAFYQYQLGTIEQAQWRGIRYTIRGLLRAPAASKWWDTNKVLYSPEFRAMLAETKDDIQ